MLHAGAVWGMFSYQSLETGIFLPGAALPFCLMVGNSREACSDTSFERSSPSRACCFLLGEGARAAVASSSDSRILRLLRTALLRSGASSCLPFLKGAWSVS